MSYVYSELDTILKTICWDKLNYRRNTTDDNSNNNNVYAKLDKPTLKCFLSRDKPVSIYYNVTIFMN